MNIHEYQAKAVLAEFGAPVSARRAGLHARRGGRGGEGAAAGRSGWSRAQIHAGGRGKGKFKEAAAGDKGGVRLARSVDEVKRFADRDARHDAGHRADRPGRQAGQPPLYRGRLRHRPELYLSVLVDRDDRAASSFVASTEGGMDIEEVAHKTPEKIHHLLHRSGDRRHAASRPHRGAGAGPDRRSRQAGARR